MSRNIRIMPKYVGIISTILAFSCACQAVSEASYMIPAALPRTLSMQGRLIHPGDPDELQLTEYIMVQPLGSFDTIPDSV